MSLEEVCDRDTYAIVYAELDSLWHERAANMRSPVPDELRALSIEIASEAIAMSDKEIALGTMGMDEAAGDDERVTREVIWFGKLGEGFREYTKGRADEEDTEESGAVALDLLRMQFAFRRFRLEYPERFDVTGDGYYSSRSFIDGAQITGNVVRDYLFGSGS